MNTIKTILICLFIGCLFDMNYGYFQLVRFLGMAGFITLSYSDYRISKISWAYIWIVSAVLINPIIKIALGRTIWNIVDVVWCVILLISIIQNKQKKLN